MASSSTEERRIVILVWASVPLYFAGVMAWFLTFDFSPWASWNAVLLSFTQETFARIDFNYAILKSLSGADTARNYLAFATCCFFSLPIVLVMLVIVAFFPSERATISSPQEGRKETAGSGRSAKQKTTSAVLVLLFVFIPTAIYFVYLTTEFSLTDPSMFPRRFVIGAFFDSFLLSGLLLVWSFAMLCAAAIGLRAGSKVRP